MNYYAVLDVGGSSIKYALMDESGAFIEKSSVPTPKMSLNMFIDTVDSIVKNFQKHHVLKGLAVSMPGAVNVETGMIEGVTALPYIHGPNMKELLRERTQLPVELENDANCAGLAEGWIGAAKDVNDFLCIVIGTGIGGAVVLDKKVRHGKNGFAGEFGYMLMEDYPRRQSGETWSSLAAVGGLINQVAKRKDVDPDELTGKKIFALAENGDPDVRDEIEKFLHRLAVGIYNLQFIIDPEKILIGGAISHREGFVEQLNETLLQMKYDQEGLTIQVERCKFGNDSNLIGALYHFLQRQKEGRLKS
ncbi:ROK family protein [Neobacillus bataviensis LMG 21833]|uniref:ROK family protein n=1 Tax=Neobacillus bataviensis LMG 21833 TaxID=1117379 RepID=K6DLN5_9BACI|nr:ROK family protein [Neobacillus bataviensis]EKN69078.1 ROK family protein [Neobacillus bataviensis LMG 21833]